jgi:hypothetical protein
VITMNHPSLWCRSGGVERVAALRHSQMYSRFLGGAKRLPSVIACLSSSPPSCRTLVSDLPERPASSDGIPGTLADVPIIKGHRTPATCPSWSQLPGQRRSVSGNALSPDEGVGRRRWLDRAMERQVMDPNLDRGR